MKKLVAIVLFVIHLFNIGGQLAFHEYLVYRSDKFFNEQISENHYNPDDLTEICIPVNMPGITDWKKFQNLNGSVRFGNSAYNYVKIKVTRHAIYLACIPNYETTRLSALNVIYARQIPDIPVPKKDHVPFGKINIVAYNCQAVRYIFSMPLIIAVAVTCYNHADIEGVHISGPGQPPDTKAIFS